MFDRSKQEQFKNIISIFDQSKDSLEDKIVQAIKLQFVSVRSSIEKFKMLEKFNLLKEKKVLRGKIDDNINEVLESYTTKELSDYQKIFDKYKDNVPVNDTIPKFARKLIWAFQLYNRGYAPFAYLAKNKDNLGINSEYRQKIISAFKKFRVLFYGDEKEDGYIKTVEKQWKEHGKGVLRDLSTKKIIKQTGTFTFEVDKIDDVLEFIKEAKYMDSLGIELSRNIQNIVLNE